MMRKYSIEGDTFMDLFTGSGAAADHMKNRFRVSVNDYMKFSAIIADAKITNADEPRFERFRDEFSILHEEGFPGREIQYCVVAVRPRSS